MRISRTTLVALLAVAGAGRSGAVTIICTVEGGPACRLEPGDWDEPALAALWQKGRNAWRNVQSATGWVETLRGNQ